MSKNQLYQVNDSDHCLYFHGTKPEVLGYIKEHQPNTPTRLFIKKVYKGILTGQLIMNIQRTDNYENRHHA